MMVMYWVWMGYLRWGEGKSEASKEVDNIVFSIELSGCKGDLDGVPQYRLELHLGTKKYTKAQTNITKKNKNQYFLSCRCLTLY